VIHDYLQLKLFGSISIARSAKPLTWLWELGARTKILFGQIVALEMALHLNRRIDPGTSSLCGRYAGFRADEPPPVGP
jgi:hypothetical protein